MSGDISDSSFSLLLQSAMDRNYEELKEAFVKDPEQLISFADWVCHQESADMELASVVAISLSSKKVDEEQLERFERMEKALFGKIFDQVIDKKDISPLIQSFTNMLAEGQVQAVEEMIESLDQKAFEDLMQLSDEDGKSLLLSIVEAFESDRVVKKLLAKCIDEEKKVEWIMQQDYLGHLPLQEAVRKNRKEVLQEFLEILPAEKRVQALMGRAQGANHPLNEAVDKELDDLVEILLKACPRQKRWEVLQQKDCFGRSMLYYPIQQGNHKMVKILLENCPQENVFDWVSDTSLYMSMSTYRGPIHSSYLSRPCNALTYAAKHGMKLVVEALVLSCPEEKRGELLSVSEGSDTCLVASVRSGKKETVEFLLSCCPKGDLRKLLLEKGNDEITCLVAAVRSGHLEMAEDILSMCSPELKTDVLQQKDRAGMTALMEAARRGNVRMLNKLIEHMDGDLSCLEQRDVFGKTAMMHAGAKGEFKSIRVLVEAFPVGDRDAELQKTDRDNWSTLRHAVTNIFERESLRSLFLLLSQEGRQQFLQNEQSFGYGILKYVLENKRVLAMSAILETCELDTDLLAKMLSQRPTILYDETLQKKLLDKIADRDLQQILLMERQLQEESIEDVEERFQDRLEGDSVSEFLKKVLLYGARLTQRLLSLQQGAIQKALKGIGSEPVSNFWTVFG